MEPLAGHHALPALTAGRYRLRPLGPEDSGALSHVDKRNQTVTW